MVQTIVPTDEELAARRLVFRYNTRTDTYIRGEHTGHPAKSKGNPVLLCYPGAERTNCKGETMLKFAQRRALTICPQRCPSNFSII